MPVLHHHAPTDSDKRVGDDSGDCADRLSDGPGEEEVGLDVAEEHALDGVEETEVSSSVDDNTLGVHNMVRYGTI